MTAAVCARHYCPRRPSESRTTARRRDREADDRRAGGQPLENGLRPDARTRRGGKHACVLPAVRAMEKGRKRKGEKVLTDNVAFDQVRRARRGRRVPQVRREGGACCGCACALCDVSWV